AGFKLPGVVERRKTDLPMTCISCFSSNLFYFESIKITAMIWLNKKVQAMLLLLFATTIEAQNKVADSLQLIDHFKHTTLQWKNAYNSTKAENLIAFYSIDAQYISSHVAGLVANGRDKLIA